MVTLPLSLDELAFPRCSEVLRGNVSEPDADETEVCIRSEQRQRKDDAILAGRSASRRSWSRCAWV